MPSGGAVALHSHNVEEAVLVLSGSALLTVDGTDWDLVAGDATWIPAGVQHRFANAGVDDLRIYWTYAGTEVTRTFAATGETVEHLGPRRPNHADLDG